MRRRVGAMAVILLGTGCAASGEFADGDAFVVASGDCSTTQFDSTTTPFYVRFSDYVADIAPDGCVGSLDMEFYTCGTGCVPTSCNMCLRPSGNGYDLLPLFDPEQAPGSQQCASLDWRGSDSPAYVFIGEIVEGHAEIDGEVLEIFLTADGEGGLRNAAYTPTTMTCSVTAVRDRE